jgi:hypothetical protein
MLHDVPVSSSTLCSLHKTTEHAGMVTFIRLIGSLDVLVREIVDGFRYACYTIEGHLKFILFNFLLSVIAT